MPALAPTSWKNILDATGYGAASPQTGKEEAATSEDCLFLNIWTPGLRDKARRPVMFYIHGGAYSHGSGSSPLYDGTRLCHRGDVVVVTVNHRLNAFGYLYLAQLGGPQFADSGNAGMLDLVMALRWVRDNIAEFGGDPNRVMVFGQSGGGAKIATLMGMPVARGLFHQAATMSGQQVTASGPLNATSRAHALLDALQLPAQRVNEISTFPKERLLEALAATDPVIGKGSLYFGPVLDERTLQQHPFYPEAPLISAQIPLIIGNTHDETRLLIGSSDPGAFSLDWEQLPAKLVDMLNTDRDSPFLGLIRRASTPADHKQAVVADNSLVSALGDSLNSPSGITFKTPPDEKGSRIVVLLFAVRPVTGSTCPAVTWRVVVGSYISFLKTGRPSASVPT